MTFLPQQETIVQYIADGVTTDYVYPFYVPESEDPTNLNMNVYVQAADATAVPATDIQEPTVAYVVNGAGVISGGTITFQPGYIPALGYIVTISRDIAANLDVNFAEVQNFNGANLDDALNKNMLIAQQNQTYALQRNLSYVVNEYLGDEETIQSNTQLPRLQDGYIWQGSGGGVVAVLLEEGADTSTLRSELANDAPVTNGAHLVGYYDTVNLLSTTVKLFLDDIVSFMQTQLAAQLWQPGDLKDFAGTVVQSGWLACDGSIVSQTTYADLYAAIGSAWNTGGEGAGNFRLPNFQRRVAVGSGGSGTATLGNTTGSVGGSETHTMTTGELASHTHTSSTSTSTNQADSTVAAGRTTIGYGTGAGSGTAVDKVVVTIGNEGSNTPFNIIQPSAVVTKIIKY